MTLPEFFGCTFIAFGPPFALFVFTIANDPVRIIILIAAAFFWLLSLLISSLWYAIIPLKDFIAFGVVFSVFFQEGFRYIIYRILRSTEQGLHAVAEDTRVTDNKHILAYVSGLGFGIISGMFALVNVLADMVSGLHVKYAPYNDISRFLEWPRNHGLEERNGALLRHLGCPGSVHHPAAHLLERHIL